MTQSRHSGKRAEHSQKDSSKNSSKSTASTDPVVLRQMKIASDLAGSHQTELNFSCAVCGTPAPLLTYMYGETGKLPLDRPLCEQCRKRDAEVKERTLQALNRKEAEALAKAPKGKGISYRKPPRQEITLYDIGQAIKGLFGAGRTI